MALFCNSLCEKSATLTSLGLFLDSELLGRCLDVLASNPKCAIQELSVFPTGPSFSLTVIENLKLFLDNNNSLRRIRFEDSNTFLEISECIMGAVNLTEVVFNKCSFEDDASVRALKRVLQKPGLTSFRLCGNQPAESLEIRYLENEEQGRILTTSIPKFQNLRQLRVLVDSELSGWCRNSGFQIDLLQAMEKSGSLQNVEVTPMAGLVFPILDANDEELLKYYCARNRTVNDRISNPSTIPKSLWPNILKASFAMGMDYTFRGLASIAMNFPRDSSRKRRRPRTRRSTES